MASYGDVLWLNMPETYYGDDTVLPYKSQVFFHVAYSLISNVTYAVKTDDDSYIFTYRLNNLLSMKRPDYWGLVWSGGKPERNRRYTWFVSEKKFS